jgi:hypothetical protein
MAAPDSGNEDDAPPTMLEHGQPPARWGGRRGRTRSQASWRGGARGPARRQARQRRFRLPRDLGGDTQWRAPASKQPRTASAIVGGKGRDRSISRRSSPPVSRAMRGCGASPKASTASDSARWPGLVGSKPGDPGRDAKLPTNRSAPSANVGRRVADLRIPTEPTRRWDRPFARFISPEGNASPRPESHTILNPSDLSRYPES